MLGERAAAFRRIGGLGSETEKKANPRHLSPEGIFLGRDWHFCRFIKVKSGRQVDVIRCSGKMKVEYAMKLGWSSAD